MEYVEKNLSDDVVSLLTKIANEKTAKKSLFFPNVLVSFVGKMALPKMTIKAKLPHRPAATSVCALVKDLKGADYNTSTNIWKQKWRADGADISVTFLPLSELKLCYQSYESRRKLAASFDVFLADKRIVHHLPTNLGKAFYSNARDKIPIPVDLDVKNLSEAVNEGLHSCLLLISGKGTTESIVVANTGMPAVQIKENIISVVSSTPPK